MADHARPQRPEQTLSLEEAYREIGVAHRYFASWRQRLFAGYFALLAALAVALQWACTNVRSLTPVPPFLGVLFTLVFWALEYRNRNLVAACLASGAECEVSLPPGVGVYTQLKASGTVRVTHSRVFNVFFPLMAALLFVLGLCLINRYGFDGCMMS